MILSHDYVFWKFMQCVCLCILLFCQLLSILIHFPTTPKLGHAMTSGMQRPGRLSGWSQAKISPSCWMLGVQKQTAEETLSKLRAQNFVFAIVYYIPRSTWRMKKVPQSIVAFIFAAMKEKSRSKEKTRQQQKNATNQNHSRW